MIETQFHPLDEIERWGNTVHGLLNNASGPPRLRVGGVDFVLGAPLFPDSLGDRYAALVTDEAPFEEMQSTHLVRVPGLAPLALPPEEVAAEAAAGRTWQHYALLSGNRQAIFGHKLNGWICIDPAGARWLVQPVGSPNANYGSANIGAALTLQFEVRPFGYLDEAPAAPVTIQASLADIGQNEPEIILGGEPNVRLRLSSIASHGRQVVIGLYPLGSSVTQEDMPCGWLQLALLGTGPAFALSLQVLHGRAEALGTRETIDNNGIVGHVMGLEMETQVSGPNGSGNYTLTGQLSGLSFTTSAALGAWPIGTRDMTYRVRDRVCSVVFNDADSLVRVKADLTWRRLQIRSAPSMTSSAGELSAVGTEAGMGHAQGQLDIGLQWSGSDVTTTEIVVRRDGAQVDSATLVYSHDLGGTELRVVGGPHQPPIYSTLEPPAFIMPPQFKVPQPAFPVHYSFTVGGATVLDFSPAELYGTPEWTPPTWQNRVNILHWLSGGDSEYNYAQYDLRRLSNHVLAGRWRLYRTGTGGPPAQIRHHRAIACQALWDNPLSGNDAFSNVAASYHPYTHELSVRTLPPAGLDMRFVWI